MYHSNKQTALLVSVLIILRLIDPAPPVSNLSLYSIVFVEAARHLDCRLPLGSTLADVAPHHREEQVAIGAIVGFAAVAIGGSIRMIEASQAYYRVVKAVPLLNEPWPSGIWRIPRSQES
jgi:hypothetical protein